MEYIIGVLLAVIAVLSGWIAKIKSSQKTVAELDLDLMKKAREVENESRQMSDAELDSHIRAELADKSKS